VKTSLRGIRLPLTAVETVTGQSRDADHPWPPAMVFETFEAGVKQVLGTILRDPELVDEARVQQAKLGQLRQAEMLEAEAELRRQQADAEFAEKHETIEQRRQRIEREAEERERAIERDKAAAERRVREQAREKEEASAKANAVREKAVTKKERQARLTRVNAEADAVSQEKRAVDAATVALAVDDALERKKAQRKAD
jgi:hypothetical protein